jgi:hypothetical protein
VVFSVTRRPIRRRVAGLRRPAESTASRTPPPAHTTPTVPAPQSAARRVGRKLAAALALAVTAVVGAVATENVEQVQSWISEQDPLLSRLNPVEEPTAGFLIVAPDPVAITPEMRATTDCDKLWDLGVRGGAVPADIRRQQVVLRGQAKDGVEILGMRAKVTSRGPAEGAAAAICPSAGSVEPIGLSFDLWTDGPPIDVAEAVRGEPGEESEDVKQFRDGYLIRVQENEPISLMLETNLPEDRITWHYDLDVLVGGERRTVRIDDGGRDFYSPGHRPDLQDYAQGATAGVEFASWGVDQRSVVVDDQGEQMLDYRGLRIDTRFGPVDIYQPRGSGVDSGYRYLRLAGRPVAMFNPPGVAPQPAPAPRGRCGNRANYELLDSVEPPTTRIVSSHGSTIERASYTAICEGRPIRFEVARMSRTGTVFTAELDGATDPEPGILLLDGIYETTDAPTPSWAPTAEPVSQLAADNRPPALYQDIPATDVGFLTEVFEDSRGLVVRFDKVDVRGEAITNVNPAVRTVVATEKAPLDEGQVARMAKERALVLLQRTPDGTLLDAAEALTPR